MRLPDALYQAMLPVFEHHGFWHFARIPANPNFEAARKVFPHLKLVTEPGSGEEFLRFHRVMMRNFKWLVENTPAAAYQFVPWTQLPDFLVELLGPNSVSTALAGIEARVAGSADELGGYIEANRVVQPPPAGANIHNYSHGAISEYEQLPADSGADMKSLIESPYNEYFWKLHGWIDDYFAAWQSGHGEAIDQSALDPHARSGHMHVMAGAMPKHAKKLVDHPWFDAPVRDKW